MSGKLTREELKGLTAEQKLEYQRNQNAARVAKYRAGNKEKADEYNRTYKKDYINRPENREKYKELNKKYVNEYNKKHYQVLATFEMMKASKNAVKLDDDAKNAKILIEEGQTIMRIINKDFHFYFYFYYFIYII